MLRIMLVLIALALCPLWAWGQGQVKLEAGTQMVADGALEIVLANADWEQDGTFVPGTATITLRSDAGNVPVELMGTNPTAFYILKLELDGTEAVLFTDISVASALDFMQGNLDLNGMEIDLLGTGVLQNETDSRRVLDNAGGGSITTTVNLNAPSQVQPGNLGATLSSNANLGSTEFRRGHQVQPLVAATGLARYYDILPTNNAGLNASFRFGYLQSELNGTNEGNLLFYRSTDGGISYTSQGASLVNPPNDWIELIGVNAFSRWTAGEGVAFSVEWLGVEARWAQPGPEAPALISWEIATEIGSDYFRVERSGDPALGWESVGEVDASQAGRYSLEDKGVSRIPVREARWYYRVVEVDIDGREQYSDIVSLKRINSESWILLSPNPARNQVRVQALLEEGDSSQKMVLRDFRGRQLWQQTLPGGASVDQAVRLPALPGGIYLFELLSKHHIHRHRLQINP